MSDITNPGPMDPMIMFLERVMRDPVFPIEKAQAAMQLAVEQQKRVAKQAFVYDLNAMQTELLQIARDKTNPAFHSKYATLEAIDRAARPVYTKYGFSITYGTAPATRDGWIQVTCRLAHRSGHVDENSLEGPVSTEGARGGRIGATPIQAVGSAVTYLRRYLLQLTLNLVSANDPEDNDGNGHDGGTDKRDKYAEWTDRFELAANALADSDAATELLNRDTVVRMLTEMPHGKTKQRFMQLRADIERKWLAPVDAKTEAEMQAAHEPIEGL